MGAEKIYYKKPPAELVREWEERLKTYGLAESQQAITTETTSEARKPASSSKGWQKAARKNGLDGCTGEMGGFHPVPTRDYSRATPDWVLDNVKVAQVIKHVFPCFEESPRDRASAARWGYVLYNFREVKTAGEIAAHLNTSRDAVKQLIVRARAVGKELFGET